MKRLISSLCLGACLTLAGLAQPLPPETAPAELPTAPLEVPDPAYLLAVGDHIAVNIYQESDLSTSQRLDVEGKLRLPHIGEVKLAGLSVREAENALEQLYRDRELLRMPLVTIAVAGYALREVSILGAVRAPGNFPFPKETTSMEIVELVTRVGGFVPTAKSDSVSVIRRTPDGQEKVETVDVESMIRGRQRGDTSRRSFLIFPGDRIWVPERMF